MRGASSLEVVILVVLVMMLPNDGGGYSSSWCICNSASPNEQIVLVSLSLTCLAEIDCSMNRESHIRSTC